MKRIILFILFVVSATYFLNAQDQTVNGYLFQNMNNQWLSPAKIQVGRPNTSIYTDRAVIGVTNGNLHLDSYADKGLFLNFYQTGSTNGNKGLTIFPNGNVGIGTNNPQSKLDVRGSQCLDGMFLQSINNQWLSPAKIQIGRIDRSIYTDKAVIGVTDGNLHLDSYSGRSLLFNFYQAGSDAGSKGLIIHSNGNVGVGIINPAYKLDVNGTIHAREVKIDNNGWADFVFDKNYILPTLAEVEAHIQEHKRLPEIPSEAEVKENGVDVGEMQVKLLQKIEELTLYVIDFEKKLQKQDETIQELQDKLYK